MPKLPGSSFTGRSWPKADIRESRPPNSKCDTRTIKMKNIGAGIAIGVAIGAGIGAAIGNVGVGIAIGIAVGAGIGVSLQGKSTDNTPDSQDDS